MMADSKPWSIAGLSQFDRCLYMSRDGKVNFFYIIIQVRLTLKGNPCSVHKPKKHPTVHDFIHSLS